MNTARRETEIVNGLIDRLSLSQPVDAEARAFMTDSKKRVMKRVLKTVGAFGALTGIYLSLYFLFKKLGAAGTVIKILLTLTLSTAVAYGGYRAARAVIDRSAATIEQTRVDANSSKDRAGSETTGKAAPPATQLKTETIYLYDGRVLRGTIISRGEQFRIRTANGVITVPRDAVQRSE